MVLLKRFEPFHLRIKHYIIQMMATADITVPHSINANLQFIFDCLGFNPMNGNFDFVFQGLTQAEKSVYCQSLQPARYRSGCNP